MSATPQTDDFERTMDLSKDQDELLALTRKLESAAADAVAKLLPWEKGFETTNAAQAIAQHAAVLAKRDVLLRDNQQLIGDNRRLTEGSQSIKKSQEGLRAEIELLRMQGAAVMTASLQNTEKTVKDRITRDSPYWSQCYADVCAAVDREMAHRETTERLKAALKDFVDNTSVPAPNCSCHVSAPCADCEEHGHTRELLASANALLAQKA